MILKGSRYENQPVITVPTAGGGQYQSGLAVFRPSPRMPTSFQYYQVRSWERFDTIAYRTLGRSDLWWVIADANPEVIYPDQLQPGTILRIPSQQ